MNEFLFLYRGGMTDGPPPTPEQMAPIMERWQAWFGKLGESGKLKDWGSPLKPQAKRVAAGGVLDGPHSTGRDTIGGYSVIKANDLAEAAEIAKGCPALETGGTVEVLAVQPM